MNTRYLVAIILLVLSQGRADAQNTRLKEYNQIGWYNYFGTFKLSDKWGLHTEYQWRRDDWITKWQQSLLRTGINYKLDKKAFVRVGYGWIETFAYGKYPINRYGKQFTEHRIFQMVQLSDQIGSLALMHRFMLEQRWVGSYSSADLEKEDDFIFLNRMRYMFRMDMALNAKPLGDKGAYAAAYDELFIGFGKNVGENVFDQNRIGLLVGYKFSPAFKLEAGYLSQIVQLSREVNGSNVFQFNNGLIVNGWFNFDLSSR
jgi:hypothetical protein